MNLLWMWVKWPQSGPLFISVCPVPSVWEAKIMCQSKKTLRGGGTLNARNNRPTQTKGKPIRNVQNKTTTQTEEYPLHNVNSPAATKPIMVVMISQCPWNWIQGQSLP